MAILAVLATFREVTGALGFVLNEFKLSVGTGYILLLGMVFFMSLVGSITVVWLRNFCLHFYLND